MTSRCKKLPCSHVFHTSCLRGWFQSQQSCPTCRMDVLNRATLSRMTRAHLRRNLQQQNNGVGFPPHPPAAPPQAGGGGGGGGGGAGPGYPRQAPPHAPPHPHMMFPPPPPMMQPMMWPGMMAPPPQPHPLHQQQQQQQEQTRQGTLVMSMINSLCPCTTYHTGVVYAGCVCVNRRCCICSATRNLFSQLAFCNDVRYCSQCACVYATMGGIGE